MPTGSRQDIRRRWRRRRRCCCVSQICSMMPAAASSRLMASMHLRAGGTRIGRVDAAGAKTLGIAGRWSQLANVDHPEGRIIRCCFCCCFGNRSTPSMPIQMAAAAAGTNNGRVVVAASGGGGRGGDCFRIGGRRTQHFEEVDPLNDHFQCWRDAEAYSTMGR